MTKPLRCSQSQPTRNPWLERFALTSLLALAVADFADLPPSVVAMLTGAAGAAHVLRLMLWRPWLTWDRPILWILHASYAWIVVYLWLRVPAALGMISASLASHAVTVGALDWSLVSAHARVVVYAQRLERPDWARADRQVISRARRGVGCWC